MCLVDVVGQNGVKVKSQQGVVEDVAEEDVVEEL